MGFRGGGVKLTPPPAYPGFKYPSRDGVKYKVSYPETLLSLLSQPPNWWPRFIKTESQFHLKNITSSSTKFHHIVASPPQKEINNIVDIIRNLSAADPYSILRSRLLQTHSLTDYARCESIMSLPLSGDMLPSALLSRKQALLPVKHQECLFLWYAFLRQLPADKRSHLAHYKTVDIPILSQHADEIYQSSLTPQLLG